MTAKWKSASTAACILLLLIALFQTTLVQAKKTDLSEEEVKRLWDQSAEAMKTSEVTGDFPFMASFKTASVKYDVPLPLLLAMARGESNFNPKAKSTADCYGVMQIQWPGTAKDLGFTEKSQLFDAHRNIHAGASYVRKLMKMFDGSLYKAVAAYNYGPGAIKRAVYSIPEGAVWYASYIHRHLETVMAGPYVQRDRALLLRFTYYRTSLRYLEYLKRQIEDLPAEIFRSNIYTYDVYLMYENQDEKRKYLAKLDELGIRPLEVN